MAKPTANDAQALFRSLCSAYASTPTNLKIIDLYVVFAVMTALIQVFMLSSIRVPSTEMLHGGLHGYGWIISFQFFPVRCSFLCRNCCSCSLSSHTSQQRQQGIQGFTARTCFCRFHSLQSCAPSGDYELSWLNTCLEQTNGIFSFLALLL